MRVGSTVGPYTLVKMLGSGSFGAVWLADRVTQIATTRVALKVPLGDEVNMEAIKQEATTWVQASGHPNVVPIIEANIYEGQVVIASEYIDSGSLEDWLRRNNGKSPAIESAVDITCGILSGLEHLHSRHIIHRDIKPANLLLQGETPRLVDFGISRILRNTSRSIMAAGTPSYMAPEAFDGRRNEQTDIWSVGVILYQMLAGRLPYPQQEMTQLIGAIVAHNPDPLPMSVPQPIQAVVNRSMAKNPEQRFRSASEMRAALKNALDLMRRAGTRAVAPQPRPPVAAGGTVVETPGQRQQFTAPPPAQPFTSPGGVAPAPTMPHGQMPTARQQHQPTMVRPQGQTAMGPGPYQQPMPQFGMARAKNNTPLIIIACVVGGLLLIGGIIAAVLLGGSGNGNKSGGGGGGGNNPGEAPEAVARKVLAAWQNGRDAEVRSMSARGYEDTVIQQMLAFQNVANYTYGGIISMNALNGTPAGDNATANWQATFVGGANEINTMVFKKEGGAWKVISIVRQ